MALTKTSFKKGNGGGGRPKGAINKITKSGFKSTDIPIFKLFYESVVGCLKGDSYYVYSHEYNGVCFYIGKGKNSRAWEKNRNPLWSEYVKQINEKYEIKIIAADLTESDALLIESSLIKSRSPVCNINLLF